MEFDQSTLRIKDLIVHELPSAVGGSDEQPRYSDAVSPLSPPIVNFFREQLAKTLAENALPGAYLEDTDSPVPDIMENQLGKSPADFVAASKKIGARLFSAQHGGTSPGLLVVARCEHSRGIAIAVLKLEKENGLRVEQQAVGKRTTLVIQIVDDLMLTEKTRLLKVGFFAGTKKGTEILVCDFQRPGAATIATFFLKKFLGCSLANEPDVMTKSFKEAVEVWINEDIDDPEKQSRYQVALISELLSNHTTVTPNAFAKEHLDTVDRGRFIAALEKRGASSKRFPKDLALVGSALRLIRYEVENGVTVSCPVGEVDKSVHVTDEGDGKARIQVDGALRKVGSKAR